MAEGGQDNSQNSEEPTQKRLDDARDKGQIASSRELNHWFLILGTAIVIGMMAPPAARELTVLLQTYIEAPHAIQIDSGGLAVTMQYLLLKVGAVVMLPLLLLMVLAAAGTLVQSGLIFSTEQLSPKLEKISLPAGVKRLFSMRTLVEFVKGLGKLAVVATVATALIAPEFTQLDAVVSLELAALPTRIHGLSLRLVVGVLAVMTLIAALDFMFQKFKHVGSLRMSRQEVKDELKQTEGDPLVRNRLRQIRQERTRRRMMANVPTATVVVTNPTHYAVALKYEMPAMDAPVLVAKGVDFLALRIREMAAQHEVPVVENPALARALHAAVEIDQEIPPEHYKAVAEVIGYVMRLKGALVRR